MSLLELRCQYLEQAQGHIRVGGCIWASLLDGHIRHALLLLPRSNQIANGSHLNPQSCPRHVFQAQIATGRVDEPDSDHSIKESPVDNEPMPAQDDQVIDGIVHYLGFAGVLKHGIQFLTHQVQRQLFPQCMSQRDVDSLAGGSTERDANQICPHWSGAGRFRVKGEYGRLFQFVDELG